MAEASRLKLHEELCELLGSKNVYFQPPESVKLTYPCIVYSRASIDMIHADNRMYKSADQYDLVVIDPDPDSEIVYKVLAHFQMCRHDRAYTMDNLNHDSMTLYYN